MQVYTLPEQLNMLPTHPRAVALGLFDGLHRGHRAVIDAAKQAGGVCSVLTFKPGSVDTKSDRRLLCTPAEQRVLLAACGVEELLEADFAALRAVTPEEFVDKYLCRGLHAATVTCGVNYRFGAGGAGDAAALVRLCAARGVAVTVVPMVEIDGQAVSSTAIRHAIDTGDIPTAAHLLGREICLRLPVVEGQHLGRTLDMPTINQKLPSETVYPRFGVYAATVEIDGKLYDGVTNIGTHPTVGETTPQAETWILGYSGDLYGKTVPVTLRRFLRQEKKFDSVADLREQVSRDAAAVRKHDSF